MLKAEMKETPPVRKKNQLVCLGKRNIYQENILLSKWPPFIKMSSVLGVLYKTTKKHSLRAPITSVVTYEGEKKKPTSVTSE